MCSDPGETDRRSVDSTWGFVCGGVGSILWDWPGGDDRRTVLAMGGLDCWD